MMDIIIIIYKPPWLLGLTDRYNLQEEKHTFKTLSFTSSVLSQ